MNYLICSLLILSSINSFAQVGDRGNIARGENINARIYKSLKYNKDGSVTIFNPELRTQHGDFPMIAHTKEICNAFGFLGGNSGKVKFSVTNEVKAIKVFASLESDIPFNKLDLDRDIIISYVIKQTEGDLARHHFQFATEVTCSNLKDTIQMISGPE
jgi:hypothetical protein